MSLSVTHADDAARPLRALLPLWIGIAVYALLLVAGNRLLGDPDTQWQIAVGQWIIDHRALPESDIYSFTMRGEPWISTQWLAQVLFARSYALAGWSGPVVLAAGAMALTFAQLAQFLARRVSQSATLVFVALALALAAPHLLARPHVLAMPVMVAWAAGLIAAADRRETPSFWLLALMALWANLHGGFVFGLVLIAPVALDAVVAAEPSARRSLALRWAGFALLALAASCCTPYGWNALLASQKILSLGSALPLIVEWRPAEFGTLGAFELCLLLGAGLALYRGIALLPTRILLLLALVHMALAQGRAAEILGLVAPLVLAVPLARQVRGAEAADAGGRPAHGMLPAIAIGLAAGTFALAAIHPFEPPARSAPATAVAELKKLGVIRVFNDYDFGGYLIAQGVPPFIDGRTELYGEKFVVEQNAASTLSDPETLFRLLDAWRIEATLLHTQSPAARLLDHVDGWQKIFSDDIATVHIRKAGTRHAAEPAIDPRPQ